MACKNEFTCTVTGKTYKVRVKLCCTNSKVIYLISCKLCKEQYVSSAFKDNFTPRFRAHKINVINGKDRCGVAKHFLTKCTNGNKVENIELQLIEQVQEGNYELEGKLCCREKYWQVQLFTLSHRMNSTWDWYSTNGKGFYYIFILRMLLVDTLALFEFLLPYSVMQQLPKFRSCMRFL